MSSCNGAPTCACGCEEGRCTCKKIKLKDAWALAVGVISFAPLNPLAEFLLSYVDNLLKFPFALYDFTSIMGRRYELWAEYNNAVLNNDPKAPEILMRIDAIDLALKIRDQQAQISRRADETMEYASAAGIIAGFFSDKAKYFSPAIDIANVLRKIDSCICEPCGEDTPPKNPIEGEQDKQSYDPLAFDLNNDGTINTINVDDSKVYVDVDNDVLGEKIGWVSKEDGLLFYDKNNNNKFDGLSELFGTSGKNGFEDLSQYDSNSDGVIDKNDEIYSQLQIWQDLNSDGKVQAGELSSLESRGIEGILLEHDKVHINSNGNAIIAKGAYIKDGNLHFAGSLDLAFDNSSSKYIGDIAIDPVASALPFMWGFGDVASTRVSLTLDEKFLNIVTNKLLDVSISGGFMDVNEFLYYWSGLYKIHEQYGIERNPASLTMGDKMWIIEKFLGSYEYTTSIENAYKNKHNDANFGNITINTSNNQSLYQQLASYYDIQLTIYSLNTQLDSVDKS